MTTGASTRRQMEPSILPEALNTILVRHWALLALAAMTALCFAVPVDQTTAAAPQIANAAASELRNLPADTAKNPSPQSSTQQESAQNAEQLMLPEPAGELPVVDDARWSANLTGNTLAAAIWWVVLLILLFAAGMPWARIAFRESGWAAGHARLIALLISAYLVWILASLEIIRFRAVWAAIALAMVGAVGWGILLYRNRVQPVWAEPPSLLLGPEVAFWATFALFLAFRLVNPDSWHPIWGGEKPMELAHINAILRSAHFPPFDPWFSGGVLNYYYYGEYLVAYLMKLSGIPSEIAFNLAQPTVMALLASGIFSVSSTLASRIAGRPARAWVGGVVGVVIVILMGNLVTLRNVLENLPSLPSPSFIDWTWAGSRAISGGITEFPYFTGLYADLHAHVVALPVTVLIVALGLEVALSSDALSDDSLRGRAKSVILPLLLITLCLGTLGASNAWDVPLYAVLVAAAIFMCFQTLKPAALGVAASAITTAASFGLAYLLFKPFHESFVALFSSVDRVRNGTKTPEFLDHLGGMVALVALGLAAWLVERNARRDVRAESTSLPLLVISAIAVAGTLVAWRELETVSIANASFLGATVIAVLLVAALVLSRFGQTVLAVFAIASIAAVIALVAWRGWDVLAISIAIGAIGALIWMSDSQTATRFAGLLIAAGGFAAGGVEVVYVVDDLQSLEDWYRMNTLFKVYNEVWIVLGIAAAALVGATVLRAINSADDQRVLRDEEVPNTESNAIGQQVSPPNSSATSVLLTTTALIVIAAGLLYPLLASWPRLEMRFPGHPSPSTLNALDWMDYGTIESASGETISFAEDRDVIEWFNSEVPGSPVIAEASIGPYRGNGSRISIATGLPAVLGWDRHERQQRYTPQINARLADLDELYNSTDPARKLELLNRYDVEFVIVGAVERKTIISGAEGPYASEAGLAAFELMVGDSLEIAFQSGATVVYRVAGTPE